MRPELILLVSLCSFITATQDESILLDKISEIIAAELVKKSSEMEKVVATNATAGLQLVKQTAVLAAKKAIPEIQQLAEHNIGKDSNLTAAEIGKRILNIPEIQKLQQQELEDKDVLAPRMLITALGAATMIAADFVRNILTG